MPSVDSGLAAWLKGDALFTTATPGGVAWADRGVAVDRMLPVDLRAEAVAEATRIGVFMGSPHVKDVVEVLGRRRDLLGKVVTLTGDRLGYTSNGVPAFVCGVAENDNGTTTLQVLRKLS